MTTTSHGFPAPDPNVDNANHTAIQALADRMDTILSARTAAQINALTGTDLWAGRQERQTDGTGTTTRQQTGLYVYDGAAWKLGVADGLAATAGSPVLASVSNPQPVMGTSPVQEWDWTSLGGWVIGEAYFKWGTGAPTGGTGSLMIPLPRTTSQPAGGNNVVGSGYIRDASTGAGNDVVLIAVSGVTAASAYMVAQGVGNGLVTAAAPIVLGAAGDEIGVTFCYFAD